MVVKWLIVGIGGAGHSDKWDSEWDSRKRKGPGLSEAPFLLAPQVRLELTTLRLTAECSAIELLRNPSSSRIPVYRD